MKNKGKFFIVFKKLYSKLISFSNRFEINITVKGPFSSIYFLMKSKELYWSIRFQTNVTHKMAFLPYGFSHVHWLFKSNTPKRFKTILFLIWWKFLFLILHIRLQCQSIHIVIGNRWQHYTKQRRGIATKKFGTFISGIMKIMQSLRG